MRTCATASGLARVALAALLPLAGACSGGDAAAIEGRGTVELTQVDLAPPAPARVVAVRVDEGDTVSAGDTVAVLTQAPLDPQIDAARARLARAESQLRDLRAGARTAEIDRARAELGVAEAEAARTARELERIRSLEEAGAASRQQLDLAATAAATAAGRRDAAREALRLLRQGARPAQVAGAEAEVRAARAQVAQLEASAGDLVLVAPVAGVVLGRWAEPGEVLGAGVPAASLGVEERRWVRVYLPARQLDGVRPGQRVDVELEGSGVRVGGIVRAIDPEAQFTPRVALTDEERADLLFGVKVALDDSAGRARAGLPVTVRWP